ncbi:uroporphyrinogen-III synthase [Microbacterium stercoris]|uniref:Uroporphyrinogen-III synthase n=1 Tax=Microbacterium stercoris TaxID=2820289 RepID=A0A939QRW8_9MICO|nr:uroporphyrinogen-III synthase [Microbacterium stercoris]MBO3663983.1 uroporphyrinogen-III synthase [Microbacterium stercoris]
MNHLTDTVADTSPVPRLLSTALAGCSILITVDRRSGELTSALERHGASVQQAAALTIESHIDDAALIERTQQLIADPPDVVVVTTGVGFRGWVEAADEAGLSDELIAAFRGAQIVARGPKARGAIQQAGLTADWVAESETAAELGEYLVAEGVSGKRVAVQHHGSGADGLDELFARHGAEVVSLTVYRWGPPPEPAVVRRSVRAAAAGEYDAVLFTSAPGAEAWLSEARRAEALDGIRARVADRRLVMVGVGPITAEPLAAEGIEVLIADRGRLGSLVRSVVTYFGGGNAPSHVTSAGRLELRSGGAVLDGRVISLSPTGTDVLAALFRAGGAVVSRAELQKVLPRSGQSAHAVEMAIARLRDALGVPDVIKTVVKRGYRLTVEDPL